MIDPATSTKDHRFHLLDALRGLTAIMVVLHHFPKSVWPRGTPALYLSVDFFFCLSGFVVAFAYERRLLEGRMTIRDFAIVRFVRLYPLYLFGLLAGIALAIFGQHHNLLHVKKLIALQLFMIPNYFLGVTFPSIGAIYPFDIPAWSLYFELVSNVAYVLLVRLRLAKSWLLAPLAALCAGHLLDLTSHGWSIEQGWGSEWFHFPVGMCRVGLSFSLGVLAFRAYRRMPHLRLTGWRGIALALITTGTLMIVLISPGTFLHHETVRVVAVMLLFPLIITVAAMVRVPALWMRPCAFLGDVSYPLYVLHSAILYWELRLSESWLIAHPKMVKPGLVALVGIMMLVAYAVLKLYDEPVRRALRRRPRPEQVLQSVAST